ncbi:hypothetical protein Tco_1103746 [Tanacetum coccineum]
MNVTPRTLIWGCAILVQQYEQFTVLEEESIDSGFARFNIIIITSLKAPDETMLGSFLGLYIQNGEQRSREGRSNKESSDDETLTSRSADEEYAMAVRNFIKFFRRKARFVRQPREEKKSFRKGDDKKSKSDRKCFRCGV